MILNEIYFKNLFSNFMVSSSELDGFDISSQIDFIEEVLFIFLIIQKN